MFGHKNHNTKALNIPRLDSESSEKLQRLNCGNEWVCERGSSIVSKRRERCRLGWPRLTARQHRWVLLASLSAFSDRTFDQVHAHAELWGDRSGRSHCLEEKEEKGELSFHSPDVTSLSSPLHLSSSSLAFRPVIWVKRPRWCKVVQGGARACKILVESKLLLPASVPGFQKFSHIVLRPYWPTALAQSRWVNCLTEIQDSVFVLCLYCICIRSSCLANIPDTPSLAERLPNEHIVTYRVDSWTPLLSWAAENFQKFLQ